MYVYRLLLCVCIFVCSLICLCGRMLHCLSSVLSIVADKTRNSPRSIRFNQFVLARFHLVVCVSYGFYCKRICINNSYIVHGLRWIWNRIPLDMMPVLCSFYSISFFSCTKWRIGCECERARKHFSTRSYNSMENSTMEK